MWLVLTLACISAVGYQIYERVSFYGSWPVNVNVEINYNKTLKFPAVTICNQNSFRATKAAEFGVYDLIEDVFSKSVESPLETIRRYNASNITVEDLFLNLGHDKGDLLFSCSWKNVKCGHEDFIPVLTDHGLCYTFSPNASNMAISAPGIDSGLKLIMNIEQYEYMNGPHDSAGVKVLLHDPRQTPLVASLGQAVSAGFSAFAGINLLMIDYQLPPYGDCGSKVLNHTTFYSTEECFLDCMTTAVTDKCGCRDIYMSADSHADSIKCNLEQYFSCIKDAEDDFFEMFEHRCKCPVSCKVAIFDPTFSEGTLSNHVVNSLLSSNQTMSLYRNFLKASETKAKMDKRKQEEFQILFQPLKHVYANFNKSLQILPMVLRNQSELLIKARFEFMYLKNVLYWKRNFQLYAFHMGVLHDRDTVSNYLSESTKEFIHNWLQRLRLLLSESNTQTTIREIIYNQIVGDLQLRKYLIREAQDEVASLFLSFSKGILSHYSLFSDLNQSYIEKCVPKSVMADGFFKYDFYYGRPESDMIRYCKNELNNLYSNVSAMVDQFVGLTETAFYNPGNASVFQVSMHAIANYVDKELKASSCRDILKRKIFRFPIFYLESFQDHTLSQQNEFRSIFHNTNQAIRYLEEIVQNSTDIMSSAFKQFFEVTNEYMESNKHSLTEIYSELLTENFQSAIMKLRNFSFEVDTRQQALHEYITSLIGIPIDPFSEFTNTDSEALDVHNYLYYNLSIQNDIAAYIDIVMHLRNDFNIRTLLGNIDNEFTTLVEKIINYLDTFNSSVRMDSNFLRNNFLKLKVFYRQMSYEYIHQQKGYDIFGLICDIGGSMGLFIGASMLTVIEVIDFLLEQTPLFRRRIKVIRDSNSTVDNSRL